MRFECSVALRVSGLAGSGGLASRGRSYKCQATFRSLGRIEFKCVASGVGVLLNSGRELVEVMALPFLPAAKFAVLLWLGAEASLTLNVTNKDKRTRTRTYLLLYSFTTCRLQYTWLKRFLPFVDILTHLNPKPSTLNPRLLREDLRVSTVKESPFLDARALRLWLSKLATDWV